MSPLRPFVLIVGAGPTGLTLANCLASYGVPFQIIDKKAGPTSDSKGLAINVASQYGLKIIGIDVNKSSPGCRINKLCLSWNKNVVSKINLGNLESSIKHLIAQPQSVTESILISELRQRGHEINWNTHLESVNEDDELVSAKVIKDNNCVLHKYSYVIGCDGKNSIVREKIATDFQGRDFSMHMVLGDFNVELTFPNDEAQYFVFKNQFFIFVPTGINRWRIVVKHPGVIPDHPVSPSDIVDVVNEYFGENFINVNPHWISRSAFYSRTTEKLKTKRLFIAGDAAHLFSPIGGTGMNTGIQDALNLGWKIAFHYHGVSDASLLDTYEKERIKAIKDGAIATNMSTALIESPDESHHFIQSLLPTFKNRRNLQHTLPISFSGLGTTYENIGLSISYLRLIDKHPDILSSCNGSTAFIINMSNINITQSTLGIYNTITKMMAGFKYIKLIFLGEKISEDNRAMENAIFIENADIQFHTQKAISVIRPDGFLLGSFHMEEISFAVDLTFNYLCAKSLYRTKDTNYYSNKMQVT